MSQVLSSLSQAAAAGAAACSVHGPHPVLAPLVDTQSTAAPALPPVPAQVANADPARHVLADYRTDPAGYEAFRVLAHRVGRIRQHRPLRSLVVTSSVPGEGKTIVAVNLSIVLARSSQRVLLIDADLRAPDSQHLLGLPPRDGLADVLSGRASLSSSMLRLEPLGIHYLGAGRLEAGETSVLDPAVFREFHRQVTEAFEWVIIDTTPLGCFADAHYLVSEADGVLLVARADVTRREWLGQSVEALGSAFLAGVVFNGQDGPNQRSYYPGRKRRGRSAPAGAAGTSPLSASPEGGIG